MSAGVGKRKSRRQKKRNTETYRQAEGQTKARMSERGTEKEREGLQKDKRRERLGDRARVRMREMTCLKNILIFYHFTERE